ncbi:MAG: formyltransferase family protein [Candidatus Methanomethylicaceae archaeon]
MGEKILMDNSIKIAALIAVKFGYEVYLKLKDKIRFNFIIGLAEPVSLDSVSGYVNIKKLIENDNIDCYLASKYSLNDKIDIENIIKRDIDVLLVLGWQRLVPDWLLDHVKIATIGVHGSPFGITKGRGRSPQNWALIMGETCFSLALFKIDKGIDSGDILMERKFNYTLFDDIETSYLKCSILVSDMIIDLFENMPKVLENARPQVGEPEYFPARKPEDGGIDWNLRVREVYNIVRALKKPYPGAFTYYDNVKIKIWDAIPFDLEPKDLFTLCNGEIYETFASKMFLVKCSDGLVLIKEWEADSPWEPKKRQVLKSIPIVNTLDNIFQRHKCRHPNMKINRNLLELYNNFVSRAEKN